jgi:hypothetical protein
MRSWVFAREYLPMFMSFQRSEARQTSGPARLGPAMPGSPQRTLREEHAHLLIVAAARRLRAAERQGLQRHEDADYWKSVAPSAVRKACALREHPSFAPLPG